MIDFTGLNQHLNSQALNVLQTIIPGGRVVGPDYVCGDKFGSPGDSFKYNYKKLTGADFSTDERFGDLVSLYASIQSCSMIDSAKQLSDQFGYHPASDNLPDFKHYKHGLPVKTWPYHDQAGNVISYIARYNLSETEKIFAPFSYIDGKWQMKHLPVPRPLYNLPALNNHADRPVLITEGEKAADAARAIVQERYAVISWPCGSKSVSKADWSPLKNKRVLIWPDADQSGIDAANDIYKIIHKTAASVKILNTAGLPDGFDAADFEGEWTALREFIKERLPKQPEILPSIRQDTTNDDPNAPIVTGSLHAAYEELGIAVNKNGNAICNMDNITRVLEGCLYFKGNVWYDEFLDKIQYRINGVTQSWTDIMDIDTAIKLQRHLGLSQVTDGMVFKAVSAYARKHTKNIITDTLDTLIWDKKPRISTFFQDICGSTDSEYTRAVSKNFLLSLIARAYSPGCKADCMPILECGQGVKKSTMLSVLAGKEFFANASSNVHHVDFFQCLKGKWIVEFAELHQFSKADITKLKDIMSTPVDTYRSSYGRTPGDYPRKSIFAGTTNEQMYLSDNTGARRFWPVDVSTIEISRLRDTRDQILAEAVSIYKSENPPLDEDRINSTWWVMPAETEEEQEDRRIRDPWEDDISSFIQFKNETTTAEILKDCLHIETARKTRFDEMRVGSILRLIGLNRVKRRRESGDTIWVYMKNSYSNSENVVNFSD